MPLYSHKCVELFVGDSWVSCITVLCNIHTDSLQRIWHNHPIHPDHCDQSVLSRVSMLCMQSAILFYQFRPSVCPMSVYAYRNGHIVTLLDILVGESFQFLCPTTVRNSNRNPFSEAVTTWRGKCLQFSTEIAVYLGNGTRYARGCYRTLIESHG